MKSLLGKRVNVQDLTCIHVATFGQGTYLEDDVSVGHMALLHACTVERGAFVGMHTTLQDGSRLQAHSMLGAGSLLPKGRLVPSGELWLGRPALKTRDLTDQDRELMAWTANN